MLKPLGRLPGPRPSAKNLRRGFFRFRLRWRLWLWAVLFFRFRLRRSFHTRGRSTNAFLKAAKKINTCTYGRKVYHDSHTNGMNVPFTFSCCFEASSIPKMKLLRRASWSAGILGSRASQTFLAWTDRGRTENRNLCRIRPYPNKFLPWRKESLKPQLVHKSKFLPWMIISREFMSILPTTLCRRCEKD